MPINSRSRAFIYQRSWGSFRSLPEQSNLIPAWLRVACMSDRERDLMISAHLPRPELPSFWVIA